MSSLDDTLYFYCRNDYWIINNLLCGNMDLLWENIRFVIDDNIGVLKEAEQGIRPPFDDEQIARLKNRIFGDLDDAAKARIIEIARADIANILGAMAAAKNELTLHRTVLIHDFAPYTKTIAHNIGDEIDFANILSTSKTPGWGEDANCDFFAYIITIPPGGMILDLDNHWHNEPGEVLLPPGKFCITDILPGKNPRCRGAIYMRSVL
ncbi:MAG: hypothetical protein FWB71_01920 [Defluviitaleaceae bacterium]|nr:hypothetical protein [Defluviitaleaceae bacterium]